MGNGVSDRVRAAVVSGFDPGSVEPVLGRLQELDLPLIESAEGRERVQAALLVIAAGNSSSFERAAALAEVDWRDVLVAAGLANEDWPERLDQQLGRSQG